MPGRPPTDMRTCCRKLIAGPSMAEGRGAGACQPSCSSEVSYEAWWEWKISRCALFQCIECSNRRRPKCSVDCAIVDAGLLEAALHLPAKIRIQPGRIVCQYVIGMAVASLKSLEYPL